MYGIKLAQDKEQRWDHMNMVINLQVPLKEMNLTR
jgi:hypothetical protein